MTHYQQISDFLVKNKKVLTLSSVLLTLIVAAVFDSKMLFASNVAVGLDGYYYVAQINSLSNGKLAYPTYTPLVIFYLTGLSWLLNDTVLAVKVGSMFLNQLLILGVLGIILRTTKSWVLSIFGSLYVATASLHFFMIGEFLNNLGAIVFILFGFWGLLSTSQNKKPWRYFAILCFLVAFGCHRSTGLILFGIGVFTLLAYYLRKVNHPALMTGIITLIYFLPFLLAHFFINLIPMEVAIEFSKFPNLPFTKQTIYDVLILLIASPLILFLIKKEKFWSKDQIYIIGLSLLSIVVHLNIFINPLFFAQGLFGRFQILVYIEVAILDTYLIKLIQRHHSYNLMYLLIILLPLSWLSVRNELPVTLQSDFLTDRNYLINGIQQAVQEIEPNSLIVAPHGDQFVITSVTGIASQNKIPVNSNHESLFVLLRFIPAAYINQPAKEVFRNPKGYGSIILKIENVSEFIKNIEPNKRKRILFDNPHIKKYADQIIQ